MEEPSVMSYNGYHTRGGDICSIVCINRDKNFIVESHMCWVEQLLWIHKGIHSCHTAWIGLVWPLREGIAWIREGHVKCVRVCWMDGNNKDTGFLLLYRFRRIQHFVCDRDVRPFLQNGPPVDLVAIVSRLFLLLHCTHRPHPVLQRSVNLLVWGTYTTPHLCHLRHLHEV